MKQNSPVWLARWSDLGICRVADAISQASRPPQVAELRSSDSMERKRQPYSVIQHWQGHTLVNEPGSMVSKAYFCLTSRVQVHVEPGFQQQ